MAVCYLCVRPGYETWFYSDAPFHLALIREHIEKSQWLFPGDPFFSGYPTPLHHSLVHVLGAILARMTGSVEYAWTFLGVIYLWLAVTTAVLLGNAIFYRARYTYGFAVLFILMLLTSSMIPDLSLFSALFIFIGYVGVIRTVERGRISWHDAVVIGLLCGLAIAIRLLPGLFGYAGIISLMIFMVVQKKMKVSHPVAVAFLVCLPLIIASPWLGNMIGQSLVVERGESALPVNTLPSYLELRKGYVVDMFRLFPFVWLRHILLSIYVTGIILLFRDKKFLYKQSCIVLRWIVIFYAVLFILPWRWFAELCGLDSYSTWRLVYVMSRMLVLVPPALPLFLVTLILHERGIFSEDVRGKKLFSGVQAISSFAILCVILSGPAIRTRMRFETPYNVRSRLGYLTVQQKPLLSLVKGEIVLSDAWTSYLTKYKLGFYCVTIPAGHSSPGVDVVERSCQAQRFFSGCMSEKENAVFLRSYGIRYVLVNLPLVRNEPGLELSSVEYKNYNSDYLKGLKILELLYQDDELILWRTKKEKSVESL